MRLFVAVYVHRSCPSSLTNCAKMCKWADINLWPNWSTTFVTSLIVTATIMIVSHLVQHNHCWSPSASPNVWGLGGHRHLLKPTVKTLRNERGYLFFIDRHTLVALKKKFSSEISGEISRNSSSCFSPTQGSLINLKIRNPSVLTKMARSSLSLSRI